MKFRQFWDRRSTNQHSARKAGSSSSALRRWLKVETLEDRLMLHGNCDLGEGHSHDDGHDHPSGCSCGCMTGEDGLQIHGFVVPSEGSDDGGVQASGGLHPLTDIPVLHSNAGADASIYLDFDGHFISQWGAYSNVTTPVYDIDGDDTTFSDTELARITEIWQRVAEDFAPFDINVTTVNPGDFSNGTALRISIGGNGNWIGPYGGVAYVNSFTNAVPNVAYVFTDNLGNGNAKYTAEAVSHEAGHAFGLQHQSDYDGSGNLIREYSNGSGDFAPIMGVGYYASRTTWHDGTTTSSTTFQDDMSILAGGTNGFGYRTDDHGDNYSSATAAAVSGTTISGSGIIEQMSDDDYFSFTTGAGQITITLSVAQIGANLDSILELRSANGSLIATANPSNSYGATITETVAEGTYHVVVRSTGVYGSVGQFSFTGDILAPSGGGGGGGPDYDLTGGVLTVYGTGADDIFAFTAGSTYTVSINGSNYYFNAANVDTVNFDGGSGNDTVTLNGSAAQEIVRLRAGSVTYDGLDFLLTATDVENVLAYGAGADVAYFYDTAGKDTFTARPFWAQMTGTGFSNTSSGFSTNIAYSSGGDDRALLYDSSGDNTFYARPGYGYLRGNGFQNYVSSFNDVRAYATQGGIDRAYLFDGSGDETFFGRSADAYIQGTNLISYAAGFDRVIAYATAGGIDRSVMYDSQGNDIFIGRGGVAYMYGPGFYNYAKGFDRVYAYSIYGGYDAVSFTDTSGNDAFLGRSSSAYMQGSGYYNFTSGFDRVYAYATAGGTDRAVAHDSAGNDSFVGASSYALMSGFGFYNYMFGFERVDAYAVNGGYDTARLTDSSGSDTYFGGGDVGYLRGSSFMNFTRGFERIDAVSNQGGVDRMSLSAHDYLFADYGNWI